MTTRPLSYHLAPALLALGAVLAACNWYLQPARAVAWATAVFLIGGMALACVLASRYGSGGARRDASDAIGRAVVFAGLVMVVSLGVTLATTLGAVADPDLSRRMSNVVAGACLVFIGNALPKMLTPLSVLQCDGARAQAFQRFAGWTWVLTGLAFAAVWLVLPVDIAKPLSLVLLASGMLLVVGQVVRLRRTRHKEA